MKQSKVSNYDWLASADELVDVCNRKGFNRKYAIDIKCAILNCYAILFHRSEVDEPSGLFIELNNIKHYSGSVLDENGTLQNTSKKLVKKQKINK